MNRLFFLVTLTAGDVEEVSHLNEDITEVRLPEIVTLRIPEDIPQTVVITGFEEEMPQMRNAVFHTHTDGDTVVETVLHSHRILCHHIVDTVGGITTVDIEIGVGGIAHIQSELRSQVDEATEALVFLSPCQMGEDRPLELVERAGILLGQARDAVDHRLVVDIEDILLPSQLCIVHLSSHRTYRIEIFLTDITQ